MGIDDTKLIVTFYAKNTVAVINPNLSLNSFYRIERPMGVAVISPTLFYVISKKGLYLLQHEEGKEIKEISYTELKHNNYHDCVKLKELILINSKYGIVEELEGNYYKPEINPLMNHENHINCVACKNNTINYITAFSKDKHNKSIEYRGILYDCLKEKIVLEGLNKPHTPRIYNEQLWFCNSGEGTLNKGASVFLETETFTRGLAFKDNIGFLGLSRMRRNKKYLKNSRCGIIKFDIDTGEILQEKIYEKGAQIYDIQILG